MAKIDETCGIGKELYQKGYSQAEKDYFSQSQKDREDTYNCGYAIGRQDAIDEFDPLINLLVSMEIDDICDELSTTDYCEQNCKYDCPQKECYLKYLEQLKEKK